MVELVRLIVGGEFVPVQCQRRTAAHHGGRALRELYLDRTGDQSLGAQDIRNQVEMKRREPLTAVYNVCVLVGDNIPEAHGITRHYH